MRLKSEAARSPQFAVQSFSGWLSRMTTNYRKYVERIAAILQEFVAYKGSTYLKSSFEAILVRM